jgi:hypothetical protein
MTKGCHRWDIELPVLAPGHATANARSCATRTSGPENR